MCEGCDNLCVKCESLLETCNKCGCPCHKDTTCMCECAGCNCKDCQPPKDATVQVTGVSLSIKK